MNFDFFNSKKIVVLALISTSVSTTIARAQVDLGRFPVSVRNKLKQLGDIASQAKENKAKAATNKKDTKETTPTKDLGEIIKAATDRKTLEEGLRENGYTVIADAFKDVTTQMGALAAYLSMEEPYKSKLKKAFENHQSHLTSILAL